MNTEQRRKLQEIADKLQLLSYTLSSELFFEQTDEKIAYDFAASLRDLEAEFLTVPHKGVSWHGE